MHWSAASVYLRIQMKFKQKSRLCWFVVSKERDKETVCYRRMPTNEEIQGFCLFICRGAVIDSDSCNHQLPKPPTVSSQGKNECTGQWQWHSVTGKKTISKTERFSGMCSTSRIGNHHQCQAEFTSNHVVLFIILNSVFVKDILAFLKTINGSTASAVFPLLHMELD